MQRSIALVLGKPPKAGTVVADVVEVLTAQGVRCRMLLPHEQRVGVEDMQDADLVVHRGLSGPDLDLLAEIDRAGVPLCNPLAGTRRLTDRASAHVAIDAAGLPCPRVREVRTWAQVLEFAEAGDVVVKVAQAGGRGQGVLDAPLLAEPPPGTAWAQGPYVVEERIPHDGTDHKLYVAGDQVFGLLKPSTLTHGHTTEGEPLEVTEELRGLALRAAAGLDLHLLGVDVVLGPAGPVVVDVNVFPGYRGVTGASQAVAEHLLSHLP